MIAAAAGAAWVVAAVVVFGLKNDMRHLLDRLISTVSGDHEALSFFVSRSIYPSFRPLRACLHECVGDFRHPKSVSLEFLTIIGVLVNIVSLPNNSYALSLMFALHSLGEVNFADVQFIRGFNSPPAKILHVGGQSPSSSLLLLSNGNRSAWPPDEERANASLYLISGTAGVGDCDTGYYNIIVTFGYL